MILKDADIREPLFEYLEDKFGKVRILEEKIIGKVRADVVMVTPALIYGIEIKSDADSYARLEKQVKYYNWYYDRNILVVGSKHAAHAAEHVPGWWGIISAEVIDDAVDFYELREASENPRVKDHRKIALLWRSELNRLLKQNKLPVYHNKNKVSAQKRLLENVPSEILWPQVCEELFQRDYSVYED